MEEFFDFETQDAIGVLAAIKKDDCKTFGELTEGGRYFSLCFGRFPVLSLCYLYSSKKILFKYEKALLKETATTFTFEDIDSYNLFKKRAGRALRLYLKDGSVVSPAEMLAVLGADYRLKYLAARGYLTSEDIDKLQKVYALSHSQKVIVEGRKIKIKPLPLTRTKKTFISIASLCCVCAIILTCLFLGYSQSLPTGKEDRPFIVTTQRAFDSVMNSSDYSRLECDVTCATAKDVFEGNLDGNGHTLYLPSLASSFIGTLKGTIINLNIVVKDSSVTTAEDYALFVNRNEGTLSNIKLTFENVTYDVSPVQTESDTVSSRYLGLLVATNVGTVENCTLSGTMKLMGTSGVNTYFGSIVARNGGIVTGCITTAETQITTDTADIGGLVGENTLPGIIVDSVNNATLSQSSPSATWSPNVGGVVCTNYGMVSSSANYGAVSSTSTASERTTVYAGGIACINNASIEYCKNYAVISGIGGASYVYIGGIAAVSTGNASSIQYSGSEGAATIDVAGDNFGFAGGITGYNNGGIIYYCFSASTFAKNGNSSYMYAGGISGCVDLLSVQYTSYGQLYYYNNCYLKTDNVTLGMPVMVSGNSWGLLEAELQTTVYDTLDALKNSGVYR